MLKLRIFTSVLRIGSLAGKFLVVFLAAAYLTSTEVSLYGQIAGVVTFGVLVVGLDFYAYANRRLTEKPNIQASTISQQFLFYCLLYLLVVLAAVALTFIKVASVEIIAWAVALLLAEHVAQELNRILVTLNAQGWAAVVLFVRSGLWGIITSVLYVTVPASRNVTTMLGLWLLCSLSASCIGFVVLGRKSLLRIEKKVDLAVLRQGLKVSAWFFVGTVLLTATWTVDRFAVGWVGGIADDIAAYVLFISVANALKSLLDASVLAFSLPRMLQAAAKRNNSELLRVYNSALRQTLVILAVLAALGIPAMYILTKLFLAGSYQERFSMFPFLIIAVSVYVASMPAHQALYAAGRDKLISLANGSTLFLFVVAVAVLSLFKLGYLTIPIAMIVAMLGSGLIRFWGIKHYFRR